MSRINYLQDFMKENAKDFVLSDKSHVMRRDEFIKS